MYDGDGDALMSAATPGAAQGAGGGGVDRITVVPDATELSKATDRIRILWGQPMLADILSGRYRRVVCGVNAQDNSHGIISHLAEMIPTSQWSAATITAHVRLFAESIVKHGGAGREPYVVKFDMEQVEAFALLRPTGRDHFTLEDLVRGFRQVTRMVEGRRDRWPVASVSFLGATSNRLVDPATGEEPSFEAVLRAMHEAGYRGDVYPSPQMWRLGPVGVFAGYPAPPGLDRMRSGGD
jgi:hypothetical protein